MAPVFNAAFRAINPGCPGEATTGTMLCASTALETFQLFAAIFGLCLQLYPILNRSFNGFD
jgi:hypothetical protein